MPDGKRVKKVVPSTGEPTIFVYDAAGKLIGEYTVVASAEDAKVAYLTADHLGSPRINTDRDGKVTSRHDYHPYGEEIITAQRTSHEEYTPDTGVRLSWNDQLWTNSPMLTTEFQIWLLERRRKSLMRLDGLRPKQQA